MLTEAARALQSPASDVLHALLERIGPAPASPSAAAAAAALRGELLRRASSHAEAADVLARALRDAPDLLPAYHCAALACVAAGDAERARSFWLALLARHADDRVARYQIGLTFHDAGDLPQAIHWYREQVRRFPGAIPAWYNLGLALYASGAMQEAVEAFSTVTGRDPRHRRAWLALGKAWQRMGRRDDAVRALLAAEPLPPLDAEPLVLAAAALAEDVELPEAIVLLDRGVAREPGNASLRWTRGSHLSNLGMHERALQDFRAALAADPADWRGHSRLLLELHYDDALATSDEVTAAHRGWARHIQGVARIAADGAARASRHDAAHRLPLAPIRHGAAGELLPAGACCPCTARCARHALFGMAPR